MNDLISRQKAIDALGGKPKGDTDWDLGCQNEWEWDTEILRTLPSAEPEQKWIPVTEALPKMKEVVLITNSKGHVRCGKYQGIFDNKNYRWWWKHKTLEEVLAWMPLPEPYRGE